MAGDVWVWVKGLLGLLGIHKLLDSWSSRREAEGKKCERERQERFERLSGFLKGLQDVGESFPGSFDTDVAMQDLRDAMEEFRLHERDSDLRDRMEAAFERIEQNLRRDSLGKPVPEGWLSIEEEKLYAEIRQAQGFES